MSWARYGNAQAAMARGGGKFFGSPTPASIAHNKWVGRNSANYGPVKK